MRCHFVLIISMKQFIFFSLMEASLNLPCGDALTMIEREQASRVDMLTCTELHGLPANVHANEHLLVDHSPLIRTTVHDFGQESSSTFAMQSEDFPALPGSQSAAPLSLGRDDSLTADNVAPVRTYDSNVCRVQISAAGDYT